MEGFVLTIVLLAFPGLVTSSRPNIVMIVADDLGWGDIGSMDPDMVTPNIDRLAREGVNMSNNYMMMVCTPSRTALLTGQYPYRFGMQHSVLTALRNGSMPVDVRTLPQALQDLGYTTRYVGKWHLGFCSKAMTPTRRGFDSFYGMYNGKGDYTTHNSKWDGYDMHDDTAHPEAYRVAWEARGEYSTHLFSRKTVEILEQHDQTKPLFLMLSYQAVHGPLQVPKEYLSQCAQVTYNDKRRKHCAMAAAMDEGIGNITAAMDRLGFGSNTLLLVTSDNGGATKEGSSNWPLRGSKITLWEGGTKVVTVLHGPPSLLPNAPRTWSGIHHAVDWYPTFLSLAGGPAVSGIDGMDNWAAIRDGAASNRNEFIYNINDVKKMAAIRVGKWKLVEKAGKPDGWYNPPPGVWGRPTPTEKVKNALFDLEADPAETTDVRNRDAETREAYHALLQKLNVAKLDVKPSVESPKVEAGKPKFHGGAWVTGWCD